jgi:hypothetical protein
MKFKRRHVIIILALVLMVLIPFIPRFTYNIDSKLVSMDIRPIFVISSGMAKDGGTIEYRGIGYQIIRWNRLVSDGTEYGYEIYKSPNYRNLNDGPTTKLKLVKRQPSG